MSYTASVADWTCYVSNEPGSWNETNACTVNGASCDRIEFVGDMRTAVNEVHISFCSRFAYSHFDYYLSHLPTLILPSPVSPTLKVFTSPGSPTHLNE